LVARAGPAGSFDGFFQRLRLEPGEHEIELYLQGHRSVRQQIYLQPGSTFRIRYTMQPQQPGEPPDERPVPTGVAPVQGPPGTPGRPGAGTPAPAPGERFRGPGAPGCFTIGWTVLRVAFRFSSNST